MPIFRKPDGEVVEEPTEMVKKGDDGNGGSRRPFQRSGSNVDEKTRPVKRRGRNAPSEEVPTEPVHRRGGNFFPDEEPTVPMNPLEKLAVDEDDGKTRIFGGSRRKKTAVPTETVSQESSNLFDDPVVGWIVIVDGPGKGAALSLGYGMNSIGRSSDSRIKLDFGDEGVSRQNHATLTYDPRGRKFFFQHGGGKNLSYVDGEPVLTPIELQSGQEILISDTRMHFVAFCGESFDWQDLND